MEHNGYFDTAGKVDGSGDSVNNPFNVNNFCINQSSQSHQYNGITFLNHEIYRRYLTLRSNSRATQGINPVNTAILSMIPEGDPDLTTYLNELFRTNIPEKQNNTFLFPTFKKPGKTEDHTPTQTRSLEELQELKEEKRLTPKDDTESTRTNSLNGFTGQTYCSRRMKKQAVEDILVEYLNIFARPRRILG